MCRKCATTEVKKTVENLFCVRNILNTSHLTLLCFLVNICLIRDNKLIFFFNLRVIIFTLSSLILLKIEEEERKLEAAIEETEKQCAEVTTELKELDLKSSRFNELEER